MQPAKKIDKWLTSLGYYRKLLAHDETCFFRAVSEQIFNTQLDHDKIRNECADYAEQHKYKFRQLIPNLNEYIKNLRNYHVSCGYIEMKILSAKYKYDIILFESNHFQIKNVTNNLWGKQILLCLVGNDHFDNVYKKEYIDDSAFCQSLVYNLVYENIFKFDNVDQIVEKMLHKSYDKKDNESSNKPQISISNNPFPYKVAKALDPTIYRNVAFDTWSEFRREWRLKNWYQGDLDFKVGTRCILNLKQRDENKQYHCYIQKINGKNGPINVYVEEIAEFRNVKYDQLEVEPNAKPWTLPYRYLKNKETKLSVVEKEQAVVPYKQCSSKKEKNKDVYVQDSSKKTVIKKENDASYFYGCALSKMDSKCITGPINFGRENQKNLGNAPNDYPNVVNHLHSFVPDPKEMDFYHVNNDFGKLSISESQSSQYNTNDENNNYTYFSQITTETSYLSNQQNVMPVNNQEAYLSEQQTGQYGMCSTQYCQYPYMCQSIPIPFFPAPMVPPPSPMWAPIMSPSCPMFNEINNFVFPPPFIENSYCP